jgi:hypothetical protein
VQQLLKIFLNICLFRAKPEQIPFSPFLMLLAIISYILADMWVSLVHQSVSKAILVVTVETAMLLGFTYAGLWIRDFPNRLVKTVTAVAGTSAIFTLGRYPWMTLLQSQPKGHISIASLFIMALMIWNVAVLGHILRSALNLPSWAGAGIAVLYFIFYIKVLTLLSIA